MRNLASFLPEPGRENGHYSLPGPTLLLQQSSFPVWVLGPVNCTRGNWDSTHAAILDSRVVDLMAVMLAVRPFQTQPWAELSLAILMTAYKLTCANYRLSRCQR